VTNPVVLDGQVVGSVETNCKARYCRLKELHSSDPSLPPSTQARQTFDMMEAALASVGMNFGHVVRTWLFADRILSWYGELNEVRSAFFRERGVFEGIVPASTGVGMPNRFGAALSADVLAVDPLGSDVKILAVPSPLQCPAVQYGSAFSRAVEVDAAGSRKLYISGTASIAPEGHTAHVGDVRSQIDLTMRVVEAILNLRDMTWKEVTRGVAYFKDLSNTPVFDQYMAARQMEFVPFTPVHADICRDDLLFEVELDAHSKRAS
jgi:enamine deaminase RidA (YjgF/YER057c/UK114 family)